MAISLSPNRFPKIPIKSISVQLEWHLRQITTLIFKK